MVEAKIKLTAMVDLNTHLRRARSKRWKGKTDGEKKATAAHASRAYWDSMTKEQRSAEMKRRAKVRAKKKRAK
jgi:hypothetical protein